MEHTEKKKFKFKDRFSGVAAFGAGRIVDRYQMESDEQWRVLSDEMPYLRFPATVEVRVIPPFAGAACRFTVRRRGETDEKKSISVYFDSSDALGCMNAPYWEAYPINDNNERFMLGEEKEMIKAITKELRRTK